MWTSEQECLLDVYELFKPIFYDSNQNKLDFHDFHQRNTRLHIMRVYLQLQWFNIWALLCYCIIFSPFGYACSIFKQVMWQLTKLLLQCGPHNSGFVNSEILLIQTGNECCTTVGFFCGATFIFSQLQVLSEDCGMSFYIFL